MLDFNCYPSPAVLLQNHSVWDHWRMGNSSLKICFGSLFIRLKLFLLKSLQFWSRKSCATDRALKKAIYFYIGFAHLCLQYRNRVLRFAKYKDIWFCYPLYSAGVLYFLKNLDKNSHKLCTFYCITRSRPPKRDKRGIKYEVGKLLKRFLQSKIDLVHEGQALEEKSFLSF